MWLSFWLGHWNFPDSCSSTTSSIIFLLLDDTGGNREIGRVEDMEDCNMRQIGSGGAGLRKEVEWIWFHYRALKYFSCSVGPRKCDVVQEASASRCASRTVWGWRAEEWLQVSVRCVAVVRGAAWDSSDQDQGGREHRGKSERGKEGGGGGRERHLWTYSVIGLI